MDYETVTIKDIILFIPNLIGYLRLFLVFYSINFIYSNQYAFLLFYFISFLLDGIDGSVARYLNQCSIFGELLDMICDRISTFLLLYYLSHLYIAYKECFLSIIIIDIFSHWIQMYESALYNRNHKDLRVYASKILRLYYTSRIFLSILVFTHELFLLSLYYLFFYKSNLVIIVCKFCFPLFILKNYISYIAIFYSLCEILNYDKLEINYSKQ